MILALFGINPLLWRAMREISFSALGELYGSKVGAFLDPVEYPLLI